MMKKCSLFIALCLFSFGSDESAKAQANSDQKPPTSYQKPVATLEDYVGRFEADPNVVENFIFDVFLEKGELWIKSVALGQKKVGQKIGRRFHDY